MTTMTNQETQIAAIVGTIDPGETITILSPHTDDLIQVNYRGREGNQMVVVFPSGMQRLIPVSWVFNSYVSSRAAQQKDPNASEHSREDGLAKVSEYLHVDLDKAKHILSAY